MDAGDNKKPIERLCSEIQLFDLCDLDSCGFRVGKFCTDSDLLARFEDINEEDDQPLLVYGEEDLEDDPDTPYDDEFDTDEDEEQ